MISLDRSKAARRSKALIGIATDVETASIEGTKRRNIIELISEHQKQPSRYIYLRLYTSGHIPLVRLLHLIVFYAAFMATWFYDEHLSFYSVKSLLGLSLQIMHM